MTSNRRLRRLLFLSVAVVSLVILSAGLSGLELLPGQLFFIQRESQGGEADDFEPLPPGQVVMTLLRVAVLLTVLLLPFAVVYMIISPQSRKQVLTRLLTFLLLVGAAHLLIQRWPELFNREEEAWYSGSSIPAGSPWGLPYAEFVADPPAWLVLAASVGLALLLSALLVGVVWFVRHRNRRPGATMEQLAQEAEVAIERLQAGSDLRDTVMRCYAEMTRVLDVERGIRRQRSMTPREFEGHLKQAGLPGESVLRLTRLFEKVRYGAKIAGEHEEQEAITCLVDIVDACRALT